MYRYIVVLLLFSFTDISVAKDSLSALQTLHNFYKQRLNYHYQQTPQAAPPVLGFSKAFNVAIAKNAEICANYATGVCGWAADGDEYLNAQEYDPQLNYKNSGITFREIAKNTIEVKLNVYPSDTKNADYYSRVIIFVMIKEDGNWVADDILYGKENSSRALIEKENADYIANPDPDSKMGKNKNRSKSL